MKRAQIPVDPSLGDGIGIDIGSTTVKVVVARDGLVVHRAYRRHHGQCLDEARAVLLDAETHIPAVAPRFVTGSAGAALAPALGGRYVHEVAAVLEAVRARFPQARTLVELGGQDAKMVHIEREPSSFTSEMNERCAAGTGATLDRCLHRMALSADVLAELSVADDVELPVVSAKCGVFAEADVVALVKADTPRERILAALLDAVVRGNLAVLAKGRPLPPQVVLLGGPHAFVPALATLWRRHLRARWRDRGVMHGADDDVIVPPNAEFFAAEGALRSAAALDRIDAAKRGGGRRFALATPTASGHRQREGLRRTGIEPLRAPVAASSAAGPLALGIDAGSTTIKAVVLDDHDVPVVRLYRRAEAGPIQDGQTMLEAVASALGPDAARVASLGVTGYAASVLGPVLGADASPVETLAHARSAIRYVPDVDVVCDVGGQDIKVLLIERGDVRSFHLSNQCAAGNGALLETTAAELGVDLDAYADVAFFADRSPEFTVGCAVFLDTQRVTCQRDGFTPAEILAGMATVLPRNIWENVVAAPSLAALGRVFVLSGGVQRNSAAVTAQLDYITSRHPDARVLVHPFPGEAGAIGAAIAGRDACRATPSRFVGFARASSMRFTSTTDASTRCRSCPSQCARTFVDVSAPDVPMSRLITGHACERGAVEGPSAERPRIEVPGARARNLLRVEASRLFALSTRTRVVSTAGAHLRVAIPRVLAMYRSAPFFLRYFEAIGVAPDAILTGPITSEDLWRRSAGRGTVDACYPVKVVQAHIADMLAMRHVRPFDVLWFPAITHAITAVRGCADTASCPVVAGTPMVTRAALGTDASGILPGGARLLTPTLSLTDPGRLRAQMFDAIRTVVPALSEAEHEAALAEARAGQRSFEESLEADGAAALADAWLGRRVAIVMLARPYHADPGLHHDIGAELWAHGRTTLSIRALPKDGHHLDPLGIDLDLADTAPFFTNSGDGEKLAAARIIAAHPYLVAIEVSSFKCGQDASIYGAVAHLARHGGRPFLALHDLDETRPAASLRMRLRTFLDAVERYEKSVSDSGEAPVPDMVSTWLNRSVGVVR